MGSLQTCNADGSSATMTACALGCGSDASSCAGFTPTNNLAGSLAAAAEASPVELPDGATIDSDTGTVTGATVSSTIVMVQNISIRVFVAPSWTLPNLRLTGTNPVAFVASGKIDVHGTLDASSPSLASDHGAGAGLADSACGGASTAMTSCSGSACGPGAGGGGGGTIGGRGGSYAGNGGAGGEGASGFQPLVGGCSGGVVGTAFNAYGGGAVQLVSASEVDVDALINVGGGGGWSFGGGGGAGGNVVIEAPIIEIHSGGGVVANGGGGDGGTTCSQDAAADGGSGTTSAAGLVCTDPSESGGNGGTGSTMPTPGNNGSGDNPNGEYGGGGGAVGRVRLANGSGAVAPDSGAVMSVAVTNDTLVPN